MMGNAESGRSKTRQRLSKLLREGGDVLTVENAARILESTNADTAKALARWSKQGWLSRIKRGVYVPVPVESISSNRALEDAWVVVPELFGPAYIGGWSAAEHWDLTEQVFRDICVFTTRSVARRHQVIHAIPFVVTHVSADQLFGTKSVWRKEKKLAVSDPTRTIVDMLSSPWTGGGIEHVIDCFKQYLKSEHVDAEKLIAYADRLRNAAVFKRLGFLAEQLLAADHPLVTDCKARLSKGNAQLDPALKGDKLVTRWRLFVPSALSFQKEREA